MGPGDIVEGGIDLIGGFVGDAAAQGDQASAERDRRKALAEILGLNPEDLAIDAAQAGPSSFNGIQEDPLLRKAGMNALNRMQDVVNSGGMDAQSMDAYGQAQSLVDQNARGAREALQSQAARRGMRNSGLQAADAMNNQQAAATRLNAAGMNTAADARTRALAAMQNLSTMSSGMRGDDYRKSHDAAQASDAISRFNAANRQSADQYNSGMQMDVADQHATALGQSSDYYQQAADRTRQKWGKAAKGVGKMANGAITTAGAP